MFNITFGNSDAALKASLAGKVPKIVAALSLKMNALNLMLSGYIQRTHLSGPTGPTTLSARSSNLRNSVRVIVAKATTQQIVGGVQAGGGTEWYGKLHEEGGVFQSKGRLLKSLKMGRNRFEMLYVGGRGKPYTITFPARPFMASSVAEKRDEIISGLQQAASEAAK